MRTLNRLNSTRASVVEHLQTDRLRFAPGSDREWITEAALDLALSENRPSSNAAYLRRDVVRNAQHGYYRSRKRAAVALRAYSSRVTATHDRTDVVDPYDVADAIVEALSPLCMQAVVAASRIHSKGREFVVRLMAGDTVTEAAVTVGVARATAYRIVAALRQELGTDRDRDSA